MVAILPERSSVLEGIELGIGTWAWGDRLFWGYDRDYDDQDLKAAFQTCLAAGVNFFDTAEVYGQGRSERILGKLIQEARESSVYKDTPIKISTKFTPFPWRLTRSSLIRALRGSLQRLEISCVDLYQIHMPLPPINIETWMQAMLEAYEAGLTLAIGVSNFDRDQMQRAYRTTTRQGVPLASNQVEYSLLNRKVEKDGLLKLCQDLGVRLIAYSPLAMGLLTGKYTPENPPQGPRARRFSPKYLAQIQPLISLLRLIGADHAGKTPSQIALNWLMCHGAIPIPGVKYQEQAEQDVEAIGWRLSEDEVAQLDQMSERVA